MMNGQKETILQFGAGKFLRAFFDLFVQDAAGFLARGISFRRTIAYGP